ncbi:hypothetical protein [Marivita sp.]|uniref:hypothetical protein n=1 Tax=Marivita sp. TaxID=2003365 RepID=UPI003219AD22
MLKIVAASRRIAVVITTLSAMDLSTVEPEVHEGSVRSDAPEFGRKARRSMRDPLTRIGEVYGSMTVLSVFSRLRAKGKPKFAVCRCVCGAQKDVSIGNLVQGNVSSCGCSRVKHGATIAKNPTLTYRVWGDIKNKCVGSRVECRGSAGAAGFVMHEPWVASFPRFLADMGEAPPGYRLLRHDPMGDFIPGNCYWGPKPERAPLPSLRGVVVGRLTILEPVDGSEESAAVWRAQCSCGTVIELATHIARTRSRHSCGCIALDKKSTTHGATVGGRPTRAYKMWSSLRQRLVLKYVDLPPIAKKRAPKFDPRWESFEAFYEDLGDPPDDGYLLTRVDECALRTYAQCSSRPERMVCMRLATPLSRVVSPALYPTAVPKPQNSGQRAVSNVGFWPRAAGYRR